MVVGLIAIRYEGGIACHVMRASGVDDPGSDSFLPICHEEAVEGRLSFLRLIRPWPLRAISDRVASRIISLLLRIKSVAVNRIVVVFSAMIAPELFLLSLGTMAPSSCLSLARVIYAEGRAASLLAVPLVRTRRACLLGDSDHRA